MLRRLRPAKKWRLRLVRHHEPCGGANWVKELSVDERICVCGFWLLREESIGV
jgi:hypothetical protein